MNIRVGTAIFVIYMGVVAAIVLGGPVLQFVDFYSMVFVVGVTAGGALLSFPMSVIRGAFGDWVGGSRNRFKPIQSSPALSAEQAQQADHVFRHIGRIAVASGLLGTVVGLVQMLQNMEDPSAIGPAMSVALLTLFYGLLLGGILFRSMATDCLARGGLT